MDRPHARPAAVCGRRHRPDQPHPLDLARRERPGVPVGHVRPGARRVSRPGPRPARRGRTPAARGDHLRHPQRQGGARRDRRGVRGARQPRPDDDLGDGDGSQRAHPVGPDRRCLLGLRGARAPLQRGPELRARRPRDAPLPRGTRGAGAVLCHVLPQCRAAERVRPVRRAAGHDGGGPARVRGRRPREHRRGLLRDDAGPHPRDRHGGRGLCAACPARRCPRVRAVLGARNPDAAARQQLPDDRRAHQRDRLGQVRAPDQGRGLPRRPGGGAGAGEGRGQHPRREHGRGHARLGGVHDALPQPRRHRARNRPHSDHDRQLPVVGPRGGPEVRPGQGDRQLDQPQGRGGRLPRQGAPDHAVRRRRRRDGLRRAGPGR